MKKITILILSVLLGGTGVAQAQQQLSLEACRERALQGNLEVKMAEMAVTGAREQRKEAFTNYFPTVSATGMAYNADKGVAGISLLDGLLSYSFMKNGVVAGVAAVQPLFAGGMIVNGNKLAKVNVEAKGEALRQSKNDVLLQVEQYYWQGIALQEKLKTLDAVAAQLDTICRDVQAAVDAGVAMRNDLLQAELKRNSIASDRLKVVDGMQVTQLLLAQCIGLPADSFCIEPLDTAAPLPVPESCRVDHLAALPQTIPYQLLEKNVEASRLQKRMEIGKNLPKVGVGVGYMYHNLLEEDRSFGVVFASVTVPLSGWWGGSHAIRQKQVQLKIAEYNRQNSRELLLIQMQQLWNEVEQAYKQVLIAKESVAKSEENARLNRDYYHAGTVSMSDLLNAETLLQQSHDQYTSDVTGYLLKRTRYLQATGR